MIYLIRHGKTEWTESKRHTGNTDIPLTEEGKSQALALKEKLSQISFDAVLTSPLKRAQETCALAGFGKQAQEEPLLKEWDYGDYEGLTSEEIKQQDPHWNLFEKGAPHGESSYEIAKRLDRLLQKLPQGKIALFAHGHCLRALTARYLGQPVSFGRLIALSPGSLSILGTEHEYSVIILWNDTTQL